MAYLPGFEHDIFISYSHLSEGVDRWVSCFYERLEAVLKQQTSKDLRIWRDTRRLDGGQLFDKTISTAIEGSGLLLALNCHAHRISDYCQQEVQWFYDKAQKDDWGPSIGDRKRIINAMLDKLPFEDWHQAFRGASGFYFHDKTVEARIVLPFRPDSENFKNAVDELAVSLAETLQDLKREIRKRLFEQSSSDESTSDKMDGNGHTFPSSSVLLDTHMKDDDYAMEVRNALRSMKVTTYFNQSDGDPGESLENFGARLKKLQRIIIVFGNVQESWVFNRFGVASEIANGEMTGLKVGVYYAPPRSKGNGGQFTFGSLTVYELDAADLRNPQALRPFFGEA